MCTESSARENPGILGVMLRSTIFKDILRTNLNEMSPSTGSSLVRTLMREDPEVFFAVISSLPVLINALVKASTELAEQLKEKYPPEMLKSFLVSLFEEIDRDALRQCGAAWGSLMTSLWDASSDIRAEAGRALLKQGPTLISGCINRCARVVNTADPLVFSTFLARVLGGVDRAEIDRATTTLAGALLDQKWHLTSWAWSFAKGRLMKKLGRNDVPTY